MFGIKYIFTLVILFIFEQTSYLASQRVADEATIVEVETAIRTTANNLFYSLGLRKIQENPRLHKYAIAYNNFILLTLKSCNDLKKIVEFTRADKSNTGNGTTDFIAIINEILDESNAFKLQNILLDDDSQTGYDTEDELAKLEHLKQYHAEEYNKSMEKNNDALTIFQQEESIDLDNTTVTIGNNSKDDNLFWNKNDDLSIERRMFNAKRTAIKNFPFIASVEFFNKFQCAGVIIDSDLVITAASCLQLVWNNRFYRENPAFLSVRVGSSFYENGGDSIEVMEVYFYPTYDPKTLNNNLAIMRLFRHIQLNKKRVKKIKISDTSSVRGFKIDVLGWGAKTVRNILQGPWEDKLSHAALYEYPFLDCQDIYSKKFVTRRNFCAGFLSVGSGACNHDVGGPGIIESELVGIISFGSPTCGLPDSPTVFTTLSHYTEWIEEIMEQNVPRYKHRTTTKSFKITYPEPSTVHFWKVKPVSRNIMDKNTFDNPDNDYNTRNLVKTAKYNIKLPQRDPTLTNIIYERSTMMDNELGMEIDNDEITDTNEDTEILHQKPLTENLHKDPTTRKPRPLKDGSYEEPTTSKQKLLTESSYEEPTSSKQKLLTESSYKEPTTTKQKLLTESSYEEPTSSKQKLLTESSYKEPTTTKQKLLTESSYEEPTSSKQKLLTESSYKEPTTSKQILLTESSYKEPTTSKQKLFIESSYEEPTSSKQKLFIESSYEEPTSSKQKLFIESSYEEPTSSKQKLFTESSYEEPTTTKQKLLTESSYKEPTISKQKLFVESSYEEPTTSKQKLFIESSYEEPTTTKQKLLTESSYEEPTSSKQKLLTESSYEEPTTTKQKLFIESSYEEPTTKINEDSSEYSELSSESEEKTGMLLPRVSLKTSKLHPVTQIDLENKPSTESQESDKLDHQSLEFQGEEKYRKQELLKRSEKETKSGKKTLFSKYQDEKKTANQSNPPALEQQSETSDHQVHLPINNTRREPSAESQKGVVDVLLDKEEELAYRQYMAQIQNKTKFNHTTLPVFLKEDKISQDEEDISENKKEIFNIQNILQQSQERDDRANSQEFRGQTQKQSIMFYDQSNHKPRKQENVIVQESSRKTQEKSKSQTQTQEGRNGTNQEYPIQSQDTITEQWVNVQLDKDEQMALLKYLAQLKNTTKSDHMMYLPQPQTKKDEIGYRQNLIQNEKDDINYRTLSRYLVQSKQTIPDQWGSLDKKEQIAFQQYLAQSKEATKSNHKIYFPQTQTEKGGIEYGENLIQNNKVVTNNLLLRPLEKYEESKNRDLTQGQGGSKFYHQINPNTMKKENLIIQEYNRGVQEKIKSQTQSQEGEKTTYGEYNMVEDRKDTKSDHWAIEPLDKEEKLAYLRYLAQLQKETKTEQTNSNKQDQNIQINTNQDTLTPNPIETISKLPQFQVKIKKLTLTKLLLKYQKQAEKLLNQVTPKLISQRSPIQLEKKRNLVKTKKIAKQNKQKHRTQNPRSLNYEVTTSQKGFDSSFLKKLTEINKAIKFRNEFKKTSEKVQSEFQKPYENTNNNKFWQGELEKTVFALPNNINENIINMEKLYRNTSTMQLTHSAASGDETAKYPQPRRQKIEIMNINKKVGEDPNNIHTENSPIKGSIRKEIFHRTPWEQNNIVKLISLLKASPEIRHALRFANNETFITSFLEKYSMDNVAKSRRNNEFIKEHNTRRFMDVITNINETQTVQSEEDNTTEVDTILNDKEAEYIKRNVLDYINI